MNRQIDIYTEIMAKVYADQGHWAEAAKIYRHLLAKDPLRTHLAEALAEAEKKMTEKQARKPEQLVPLFQEWIDLLFKNEKLQKLKKLKKMY
jgi:methionine salvage enolase-phosphatase E1